MKNAKIRLTLGVCFALFLLTACVARKPKSSPRISAAPPETRVSSPRSPAEKLVAEIEALNLKADDQDLDDKETAAIEKKMEKAFSEFLKLPNGARSNPRLQGAITRMCDLALQIDLDANAQPETSEGEAESPKDEVLSITTFASPEELKKTYEEVRKASAGRNLGIEIPTNKYVLRYVNVYQTKFKDWFDSACRRGAPYIPRMKEIFRNEGVPESLVYLALIESGFNPYARSRARAVGMWQFISGTARRYGMRVDFWEDQRRDPVIEGKAAARYLKDLHNDLGDWLLALASYNTGEGRIKRFLKKHPGGDFWDLRKTRYIRRQTREYVPAILAAILINSNPEAYGFNAPSSETHEPIATIAIDKSTDVRVLAKCAGITTRKLLSLNPSLRRYLTPPREFNLKIPANRFEDFKVALAELPPSERVPVTVHIVRRGQTLGGIARKYRVSVSAIRVANRVRGHIIHPGQKLVIPLGLMAGDPTLYTEAKHHKRRRNTTVYRVRRGDTLSRIALRAGISVRTLKRLNHLTSDRIKPGKRLVLSRTSNRKPPPRGRITAPKGKQDTHPVQPGDTLWALAKKYNTTIDKLCRANRISPGHRLHPGDVLVIP